MISSQSRTAEKEGQSHLKAWLSIPVTVFKQQSSHAHSEKIPKFWFREWLAASHNLWLVILPWNLLVRVFPHHRRLQLKSQWVYSLLTRSIPSAKAGSHFDLWQNWLHLSDVSPGLSDRGMLTIILQNCKSDTVTKGSFQVCSWKLRPTYVNYSFKDVCEGSWLNIGIPASSLEDHWYTASTEPCGEQPMFLPFHGQSKVPSNGILPEPVFLRRNFENFSQHGMVMLIIIDAFILLSKCLCADL